MVNKFVSTLLGSNKKFDDNYIHGGDGQDSHISVRVLLVGRSADKGSGAGSGRFSSDCVRSVSGANAGSFTPVNLV